MKPSLHLHLHPNRISYMCVTATIAHIHSTGKSQTPHPHMNKKETKEERKILRNLFDFQKQDFPTRIHPLAITQKRICLRYVITYSFVLRLITPDEDAMLR